MAEPIKLEWDRAKAVELVNSFRTKWKQKEEAGITGRPDAGTNKPNSPSVYDWLLSHGKAALSRKNVSNFGASDILEEVLDIVNDDEATQDDIDMVEDLIEELKEIENQKSASPNSMNPANTPFHTIVEYEPADGDEPAKITRGVMYGHYLTPAYYEYRKDKAKKKQQTYSVNKPKKTWSNSAPGKAKPPLWEAMFGSNNSLKTLLDNILELLKGAELPPGPIDVDFRFNKRTIDGLSDLSSIRNYVYSIVENPTIYQRGKSRKPMTGRLNNLASNTPIRINSRKEIETIGDIATITLQTEEGRKNIRLDEIPGYEKIKQIKVSWPTSNTFLLRLMREVMGDEVDTFQKPGTTPEEVKPGLMLKAVEFSAEAVIKDIEDLIMKFFGNEYEIRDLLAKLEPHFESAKEFKKRDKETLGSLFYTSGSILGQDISVEIIKWLKEQDIDDKKEAEFFIKIRPFIDELKEYTRDD